MCGIAGIFSPIIKNVTKPRLQAMTDVLLHRGPDGEGFWINENASIGFGHRRLSIIDMSPSAAQPMWYADRFVITYNGELYNYIELKKLLQAKGFQFTNHSDTEVVLAAYAFYGVECLQHFDGMFAFAIWDTKEQVLFCARDRFGEKPFYYSYNSDEQQLIFASELKALWAAGLPKEMDNTMLLNYISLGWVQNPTDKHQTFYNNIFSLPPAHYFTCRFTNEEVNISILPYWDIDKSYVAKNISEASAVEKFVELFTTSVSRRLRSDVAIGSSLSGGLDSSSIVATIQDLLKSTEKQKTFSAVFPGFEKDESNYINALVEKIKVDNFTTTPSVIDFNTDFQKLLFCQEEPFQSSSIYAQYKVYELAKQHNVTVVLDGQGADETLAGYTKYYHWYWQEQVAKCSFTTLQNERECAAKNGHQIPWNYKNYGAAFVPQLAANLLETKSFKSITSNPSIQPDFLQAFANRNTIYKPAVYRLNDILYFNTMQFGLEELLRYADRNSMAHSIEVRLPFLSHELVEFIFSLPSFFKIKNGFTKHLLRMSMQKILPSSIAWRTDKIGFEPPQKQWMENATMKEMIQESKRLLVKKGVLHKKVLDEALQPKSAHEANNDDWQYLCAAHYL